MPVGDVRVIFSALGEDGKAVLVITVTGLGPGYIISGPRPEFTLLTWRVRQEPPLSLM